MFGYVKFDEPNLYVKDLNLYKAMYCGLCKGIAASCGQRARLSLSYDVTFLSILLHNMMGVDVVIKKQNCLEHSLAKRPIAVVDELTKELGALNTALTYYKLTDDILDGERGSLKRTLFKKGFKRAKKRYPEMILLVENYMKAQANTEKERVCSPEGAADASATMMKELSAYFLKEKRTEATDTLFYELGKWVYLIDALDDYEKDKKKGNYNPFVLSYESATKELLMKEHGREISYIFDALFYSLRESLAQIPFHFNRDLTDNVLLRGLPMETARIIKCERCRKQKSKV